jgi:hypothetical protein
MNVCSISAPSPSHSKRSGPSLIPAASSWRASKYPWRNPWIRSAYANAKRGLSPASAKIAARKPGPLQCDKFIAPLFVHVTAIAGKGIEPGHFPVERAKPRIPANQGFGSAFGFIAVKARFLAQCRPANYRQNGSEKNQPHHSHSLQPAIDHRRNALSRRAAGIGCGQRYPIRDRAAAKERYPVHHFARAAAAA